VCVRCVCALYVCAVCVSCVFGGGSWGVWDGVSSCACMGGLCVWKWWGLERLAGREKDVGQQGCVCVCGIQALSSALQRTGPSVRGEGGCGHNLGSVPRWTVWHQHSFPLHSPLPPPPLTTTLAFPAGP
jgi:hypothetical protein